MFGKMMIAVAGKLAQDFRQKEVGDEPKEKRYSSCRHQAQVATQALPVQLAAADSAGAWSDLVPHVLLQAHDWVAHGLLRLQHLPRLRGEHIRRTGELPHLHAGSRLLAYDKEHPPDRRLADGDLLPGTDPARDRHHGDEGHSHQEDAPDCDLPALLHLDRRRVRHGRQLPLALDWNHQQVHRALRRRGDLLHGLSAVLPPDLHDNDALADGRLQRSRLHRRPHGHRSRALRGRTGGWGRPLPEDLAHHAAWHHPHRRHHVRHEHRQDGQGRLRVDPAALPALDLFDGGRHQHILVPHGNPERRLRNSDGGGPLRSPDRPHPGRLREQAFKEADRDIALVWGKR